MNRFHTICECTRVPGKCPPIPELRFACETPFRSWRSSIRSLEGPTLSAKTRDPARRSNRASFAGFRRYPTVRCYRLGCPWHATWSLGDWRAGTSCRSSPCLHWEPSHCSKGRRPEDSRSASRVHTKSMLRCLEPGQCFCRYEAADWTGRVAVAPQPSTARRTSGLRPQRYGGIAR